MIPAVFNSLQRGWRRIVFRSRRAQLDRELAEEIEFHRLLAQAERQRCGAAPDHAFDLSLRQLGNTTKAREESRDMWSFKNLERTLEDIRYASRMFRKTPGFTGIAVLSLALGIGGNAAMFSLVNALLIRPLPYFESERLVRITGVYPRAAIPFYQERSRAMEVASASTESEFNLTGSGPAVRIFGSTVSANLFSILGTPVARGRAFAPGEDSPGRDAEVIISYALWQTKFNADPSVIGHVIALNGQNRQIVGIMPSSFAYPSSKAQLWVPMHLDPSDFLSFWGGGYVPLVARLKPGVTAPQARAGVKALAREFLRMYPYPMPRDYNLNSTAIPLQQDVVGNIRGRLMILFASVGVVLLIACTNVASLLLSRATVRRKEIALRVALGAGRLRIVRQLLTESVLLALAGGLFGITLGIGALSIFKSVLPSSTPGLGQANIDWTVAAAMCGLALLTGLAFGIAPAMSASQLDPGAAIRTGSQRSAGAAWVRLRTWLIGAEVALTVVLVVSAGLLLRSLYKLSNEPTGFGPEKVVTLRISPNASFCKQRAACIAFYDRLMIEARSIPGVSETAIASALPLDGAQPTLAVDVEDHPRSPEFPSPLLWAGAISPGYIKMLNIPLLAGRDFAESDGPRASRVILISAATARHFWPGVNPIGKHIKTTAEKEWRTVVGVVGDVHQFKLGQGFPEFIPGAIYMPYVQAAGESGELPATMALMLKTRGDSDRIGREIRLLAQDQDRNVPVGQVVPLEDIVGGSISDFRSTIAVFISFAAAAILMAAIGIYGLVSYWVSQRTYEIGVRVAIGASRPRIVSMVLGQGLKVALFGAAAGIVTAFAATRFLAILLFGVTATDPLTFLAVTAFVLCIAALATVFPAWRASRIDPVRSLRVD